MVSNVLRPRRDFAPSYYNNIFVHSSAEGAKPRKKSAATLAKEARVAAAAAKRSAAAKARQDQASDAQNKGKEAKKAARKRLEEAKGKKRMADTEAPAEPKKRRTFPHETTQGGCDSSTESPSLDRSTADATHSSTPEPAQTHAAQTTPGYVQHDVDATIYDMLRY
ncbi:hypothetical protein PC110_g17654 [Phytophthora cactorum]|uniref:Uncharacterized protein n=1 Tax=Phytophthora cactorum TaxID=29920 RepID=A0A329RMJ2_9STRA|nr:hypothetical protein PC110_g17654 [Phytophthora cactorum]